jgi:biotin carboxyl carrier protein
MKMEIPIMAEGDGTVSEVLVEVGKEVMAGSVMIKF